MENNLNLEQVYEVISLLDTIKMNINKIDLFKEEVEEYLKNSVLELSEILSEEELQAEINRVTELYLCIKEQVISVKDFLLEAPNIEEFINTRTVSSLEELINILNEYINLIPAPLIEAVKGYSHGELGSNKYYNELSIEMIKPFIDIFHKIINQPKEYEYVASPYDLNYELLVAFETEESARQFAQSIAPSVLWLWKDEDICTTALDSF
ncbi:MAG: hypothetical protein K0R54_602 [Clostridiaceae bacterium]|jgi:hypothetical protein|nr:hypothetical protein [Clostridiaceae bacterium]